MDSKEQMNQLRKMMFPETGSIKIMNELLDYIEIQFKPSNEQFGHVADLISVLLKEKATEISEIYKK